MHSVWSQSGFLLTKNYAYGNIMPKEWLPYYCMMHYALASASCISTRTWCYQAHRASCQLSNSFNIYSIRNQPGRAHPYIIASRPSSYFSFGFFATESSRLLQRFYQLHSGKVRLLTSNTNVTVSLKLEKKCPKKVMCLLPGVLLLFTYSGNLEESSELTVCTLFLVE